MKYLLTPKQQELADYSAIRHLGIPGMILMENAASGSAHCIAMWIEEYQIRNHKPSILILCGSGNNGGDGFAVARHLYCMNRYKIHVAWIGDESSMSEETRANFHIIQSLGIAITHILNEDIVASFDFHVDCIIDAMIGTGGSSEIRGIIALVLEKLSIEEVYEQALCFSLDLPTGIHGETGEAFVHAFRALGTCTMFAEKVGMYLYPAKQYCGHTEIISLGAPDSLAIDQSSIYALEQSDITAWIGKRNSQTSKKDYGRVLIIAGSETMPGAAALSAHAALRSGAGLVEVLTTSLFPSMPAEVLPTIVGFESDGQLNIDDNREIIEQSIFKANAIVCGPGLGRRAGNDIVKLLLSLNVTIPVIIDADSIPSEMYTLSDNWILTPHGGECSRLSGITREEIERYPLRYAQEIAHTMQCIIHLKSVPSISTNSQETFLTIDGNPGMASGGSGDVLSGIVGAFAARGLSSLKAIALASMVHAKAGDFAQSVFGEESLTASDIIASIPHILDGSLMDSWEDEL